MGLFLYLERDLEMNQRQIKYFLEVYKQKSISKAAANLFISPQGLSKTISSLEKELGVDLFKHQGNRIIPTDNAAKFSIHAKNIMDEYRLIEGKLFLDHNTEKPLTIHCSYDVPQLIGADFFYHFNQAYPKIRINIKEFPDLDILDAIYKNKIELAICPGPFDYHKLHSCALRTEPFCLIVPISHPLAQKDLVTFEDLSKEPLVVKDTSNPTSMNQLITFLQNGMEPNVILETSDTHLIHQMAEENLAIGMSLLCLAKKSQSDKVKIIPFQDQTYGKTLYLVHNKSNLLSYEARVFYDAITDYFLHQS